MDEQPLEDDDGDALAEIVRIVRVAEAERIVLFGSVSPERRTFSAIRCSSMYAWIVSIAWVCSLGGDGVLAEAYRRAGFRDIVITSIPAPVPLASPRVITFTTVGHGEILPVRLDLSTDELWNTEQTAFYSQRLTFRAVSSKRANPWSER